MRVADLRKWLDDEEAKWTEEDKKYLGEFADIHILSPHHTFTFPIEFKGWDYDNHLFWDITGLGIFFDVKRDENIS